MKAGEKLGRFELKRRLGHGAVGEVFLARDPLLDTDVCLKLVHEALAREPEILARFSREVLLSRRVTHPNVCRIFDLHEEDEVRFVTMEFIPGETLANELYAAGAFTVQRSLQVAIRLCRALAVAHQEGVIHRDLKPGNIVMRGDDDPVILDFGIATALDVSRLTRPGIPLGTTHYIAPEVWLGATATPQADLYALGVILYNMVTAAVPFKPKEPLKLVEEIEKGLTRLPSSVNPGVPKALDELIARTMAYAPEERPSSAEDMAVQLERFLELLPTSEPTEPQEKTEINAKALDKTVVTVRGGPGVASMTMDSPVPSSEPREQGPSSEPREQGPSVAGPPEGTEVTMAPRSAAPTFGDGSFVLGGEVRTRIGEVEVDEDGPTAVDLQAFPDGSTEPVYRKKKSSRLLGAGLILLGVLGSIAWFALRSPPADDPPEPPLVVVTPEPPVEPDPVVEPEPVVEPDPVVEPTPSTVAAAAPVVTPRPRPKRRPTRRPVAKKEDQAFKTARAQLQRTERSRGILRGDDRALDELYTRFNAAARDHRYDEAARLVGEANKRAASLSVDSAFVDAKLRRFNKRFKRVKDPQTKERVGDLLGLVVGQIGTANYKRANATLNKAFAELS